MRGTILSLVLSVISFFSCETDVIKREIISPAIVLNGNKIDTAYLYTIYTDHGAKVLDCRDGLPSDNDNVLISDITGTVNTSLPGAYFIKYNANDVKGDPLPTATRTVHVVGNSTSFLNGAYNVHCTCTAAIASSGNQSITTPSIIVNNYTAIVTSNISKNFFDLSALKIGLEYVIPFPAPSLQNNIINVGFYHRDFVCGSSVASGTLSATKNTFTIESTAYQFSPAIRYVCKNVYTKQLVVN